jgi:restriction endonuclease Mrr
MSSESEQKTALQQVTRLDAEQFTSLAEDFLKKLGYKRGLHPTKATLEGEKYIVEMELKNKTANIQINTKTKEIREFEIQEKASESALSRRSLLLILGISASAAVLVVLKLMGIFSVF